MARKRPGVDRLVTCRTCGIHFVDSLNAQRERATAGGVAAPVICFGCLALERLVRAHQGTVAWYSLRRGFGFIHEEDGIEVFVHASALADGTGRVLRKGQRVAYQVEQSPRGPRAVQVHPAEEIASAV